MALNLTYLTTLRELARHGTMAAVSIELNYTAGAVSQQIAALERSVGTDLISRVGRHVVLTDAGAALVAHADLVLGAEQAALDAVHAAIHDVNSSIFIGIFGSVAAALLPSVLATAHANYPHLTIQSRELDIADVVTAVQRGHVDLAFGVDYPHSPMSRSTALEMVPLRQERFSLAVAPGFRGIDAPCTIDLADASRWDWILPPADSQFGRTIRVACRHSGFEPRVVHELTDTALSLALAARGLGAMPVTSMMMELNKSALLVPIELTQHISREIVLARLMGADARPGVRAATEIIRYALTRDSASVQEARLTAGSVSL